MYHLIVVAHPVETSFTMAVARAYADELDTAGHAVRMRDLYRMKFDPILPARELHPGGHVDPVVAQGQEDILESDVVTVIYPLWWLSMPAILKGYIDRVFARGFAYESGPAGIHGLLKGKKCALVTLSGAPHAQFARNGRWEAVEALQDTHIFSGSGFNLVDHLHLDEIQPDMPEDMALQRLTRIRLFARKHFC